MSEPLFNWVNVNDIIGYATRTFSSVSPIVFLLLGIGIAFFIVYGIISLINQIREG